MNNLIMYSMVGVIIASSVIFAVVYNATYGTDVKTASPSVNDNQEKSDYTQIENTILNLPKCDLGEVLFFKSDKTHVCFPENEIRKSISKERLPFGWILKEGLVDFEHINKKMSELEFDNTTQISLSDNSIIFTQEFRTTSSETLFFYLEKPFDTVTNEYYPIFSKNERRDPRISFYGSPLRDLIHYSVPFDCPGSNKVISGNLMSLISYDSVNLVLIHDYPIKDDFTQHSFEFSSMFPTDFKSNTLEISDVREIHCIPKDPLFSSIHPSYYFYTGVVKKI